MWRTYYKHYLLNNFINIIERKGYEWEILKDKAKISEKYDYTNRIEGYGNEPEEILKNHFYPQNRYDKNFN